MRVIPDSRRKRLHFRPSERSVKGDRLGLRVTRLKVETDNAEFARGLVRPLHERSAHTVAPQIGAGPQPFDLTDRAFVVGQHFEPDATCEVCVGTCDEEGSTRWREFVEVQCGIGIHVAVTAVELVLCGVDEGESGGGAH